jgi:hypothetical protein
MLIFEEEKLRLKRDLSREGTMPGFLGGR